MAACFCLRHASSFIRLRTSILSSVSFKVSATSVLSGW
ncbi:hypothetical protein JMJ77_0000994 [Colletotrichum scovillei]|uniref:Uncharacterized protein n=1 Tax=Colletotrichum scovillei TaxID=1209932 RepID=A0A9P7UHV5_9PEZI|nr:hypothetical protein JMJ77_0000994 [Colletotrichum scovillei]KAG7072213.1 hypothetical protein JMJ76_0005070 [Colletotrichum scovillei]KAG7080556.1 hypothetical protein JMJ78_0007648 [Colletotrichum scovillei]